MAIEVRIASPCEESWESMRGDERARFCQRCQLHVFNLASLGEAEVRALVDQTGGSVCARVYRRRDGTVLTRDCPTGVARLRRRARRGLVAAASLLAALVGFRALGGGPRCTSEVTAGGWFDAVVRARVFEAREALRETRTFGPLIDEFYPARPVTMGRVVSIRVIRGDQAP